MAAFSSKAWLDGVVSKLYRPPGHGAARQVFAVSRRVAEELPRLPSVAVISIAGPTRPFAALDGFENVLRLCFADVDFLAPELSNRARAQLSNSFTAEHAAAIVSFVDGLPDTVRTVIVHCEGGYSRSCAVALGLHQLMGYQTDVCRLAEANKSIWSVLTGRPRASFPYQLFGLPR